MKAKIIMKGKASWMSPMRSFLLFRLQLLCCCMVSSPKLYSSQEQSQVSVPGGFAGWTSFNSSSREKLTHLFSYDHLNFPIFIITFKWLLPLLRNVCDSGVFTSILHYRIARYVIFLIIISVSSFLPKKRAYLSAHTCICIIKYSM